MTEEMMWFGNLPMSIELQWFHYFHGKIQYAAIQFFYQKQHPNPNLKQRYLYHIQRISTLTLACLAKPSLYGLNLIKSPIK